MYILARTVERERGGGDIGAGSEESVERGNIFHVDFLP